MKQEKKNRTLAFSLIGLSLVGIALFFYQKSGSEIDKDIFKIKETTKVDKVILASPKGEVELSFNGSRWSVNNQYPADEQLITVLFATLQQVEAKRKAASSLIDSLSHSIQATGVKVSLFEQGEILRTFYVGGNVLKTEAYFLDNAQDPYLMNIPGYRVYVAGIFELDENGWRDKRIFNFNWRNFKRLTAQFSQHPDQNFEISDQGNGFDLNDALPSDTTRLNDYLDAVSLLVADHFASEEERAAYDSLAQTQPLVTIKAFDLGNNPYSLQLYRPLQGKEEVFGKMDEGDQVLFGLDRIQPVLKTKDYFRKNSALKRP